MQFMAYLQWPTLCETDVCSFAPVKLKLKQNFHGIKDFLPYVKRQSVSKKSLHIILGFCVCCTLEIKTILPGLNCVYFMFVFQIRGLCD